MDTIHSQSNKDEKAAYVRETALRYNKQQESVGWGYVIAGGLMIIALAAISLNESKQLFQTSVLHSTSVDSAAAYAPDIAKVRTSVGLYDSGEWSAIKNPNGDGTVVLMSNNFMWLVNGEQIFNINGLAKSITPDFPEASGITPEEVLAMLKR